MKACVVSPEINGFGIESSVGTVAWDLARFLRSSGDDITLVYTGRSPDTLQSSWKLRYQEYGIHIQKLSLDEQRTFHLYNVSMRSGPVMQALPADVECVYGFDWQADLFHLVRARRFSREKTPLVVTLLSNGTSWQREAACQFPLYPDYFLEIIDDWMELYIAKHSDYTVALDKYGIDWLQEHSPAHFGAANIHLLGYPRFSTLTGATAECGAIQRLIFFEPSVSTTYLDLVEMPCLCSLLHTLTR